MKTFTFYTQSNNELNVSSHYGIRIATAPLDTMGTAVSEAFNVPGRVRKPVYYNGQWNNVTRTYNVSFPGDGTDEDISAKVRAINTWLYSDGFYRLEDDYDPDVYRLARCNTALEFSQFLGLAGQSQIEFECDPRKFLKSGETLSAVSKNSTLSNPGLQSNPIIVITASGSGTLTIGSYTVPVVSNPGSAIKIDSELMTITNQAGNTNYSGYIGRMLDFPRLVRGNTTVTWSGSITSVSIAPNWWQP